MDKIKSLLMQKDVLLAIITTSITTFFGVYLFFKDRNKELSREKLEKVYFPIFIELENIFFKYKDEPMFLMAVTKVKDIIDKNRLIAGNTLYYSFKNFWECKEKDKLYFYEKFSNLLIKDYNSLCKKVGIPKISATHRFQNGLYDKKGKTFFLVKVIIQSLFIIIVVFAVAFSLLIILLAIILLLLKSLGMEIEI